MLYAYQITKSTNTEPGEGREASTMGMKHQVRYAVYKVMGSIHPQIFADKTGFSQEDAENSRKHCLHYLMGILQHISLTAKMEVRKMYWWQEESRTPSITSAKIQERFSGQIIRTAELFRRL
ncbi:MAG: type I CRISPR-associated protein Cas7 [Lachnospiraceae bacterium]